MGTLAAFGLICAVWAAFGWLIPGNRGGATVCLCRPGLAERSTLRRYVWLRDMGLLRDPILLVDCGLSEGDLHALRTAAAESTELRVFTPLEWEQYRETEREARVFGA